MDKTVLVEQDIKEGERLLRALDQAEVPVTGALWLYRSEADVWRGNCLAGLFTTCTLFRAIPVA